jgi:ABC-type Zn2+ transport system substrate-binding protein/surface adhesin
VHTVNLIAKSVLKPFDVQKKKDIQAFNNVAHALANRQGTSDIEDGEEEKDKDEDEEKDKDGEEDKDEDDNELDAVTSLEPIRSMLLKVCLRVPSSTAQLTLNLLAMENCICAQELDDYPLASLVQDALLSWPPPMHDAPGRINTLEFYIQHA